MTIAFTKMHGAGNDYIYLDAFRQTLPADISALVSGMCDRHKGIGADGVIAIEPSSLADARMRMWNADGTPAEMCGNGIRCVAKYLFDRGIVTSTEFHIETDAGLKCVWMETEHGTARRVRVSMGKPIFEPAGIPTLLPGSPPVNVPLTVESRQFWVTSLSMGNPHCIVLVDDPGDEWVHGIGPLIERHAKFPNRTNVEFVQVLSRERIRMRVWERGSGETLACGTGACAAAVGCSLMDHTERHVFCELPGGVLEVDWQPGDNLVYLTGPAEEVFQGVWPSEVQDGR
jgi:diaminopimelate epimerase